MATTKTTVRIDNFQGRPEEVDLDDRVPIVDHILNVSSDYRGELEQLRAHVQHQDRVLRAVLLGCSRKDFRHTVQHFGLRVQP